MTCETKICQKRKDKNVFTETRWAAFAIFINRILAIDWFTDYRSADDFSSLDMKKKKKENTKVISNPFQLLT